MSDEQFDNEIAIQAFEDQLDGYPMGHPARDLAFRPITVKLGTREAVLELPACGSRFTPQQKALLLNRNPDWRAALNEVRKECP